MKKKAGHIPNAFTFAEKHTISRREFLKLAAISAASTTAIAASPLSSSINRITSTLDYDGDLDQILQICSKSPLYQEVVNELEILGFEFTCDSNYLTQYSMHESLLGMILRPSETGDPRMGAVISLTFDFNSNELNMVESVMAWCLIDLVQVISVRRDKSRPLYAALRSERIEHWDPPSMNRPQIVNQWSFVRENPPPLLPEDMVLEGWPPLMPDRTYWFFNGSSQAEWVTKDTSPFYRCAQISEHLSTGIDQTSFEQQHLLNLTFPP